MMERFKVIGMAIFLTVFLGCGGSSSGGGSVTRYVTTIAGTAGVHGSADGVGRTAQFYYPVGITTDGANLYVTDGNNHTIRKVVIATGAVTTIAGTAGSAGSADGIGAVARFSTPIGITTDGINLYVADSLNCTIRKVVISTAAVTTIAGIPGVFGNADAPTGSAATFHSPAGITTDGINLYVADSLNCTIRKIAISTAAVTTIAGTAGTFGYADGFGVLATFNVPLGITTDGANLYVADSNNNTIRQIVIATGAVTTIAGLGPHLEGATDGTQAVATFFGPVGIIILTTNLYFVADTYNDTIREIY